MALFSASTAILLGFIRYSTVGMMDRETRERIDVDYRVLTETYRHAGIHALRRIVEAGGETRLTVWDSGPGISEVDRARVLERFVRLDSSRTTPGSGLGLSLVAAVAKLHGASLTLGDN
jgi:signal transduction histidine kinase